MLTAIQIAWALYGLGVLDGMARAAHHHRSILEGKIRLPREQQRNYELASALAPRLFAGFSALLTIVLAVLWPVIAVGNVLVMLYRAIMGPE